MIQKFHQPDIHSKNTSTCKIPYSTKEKLRALDRRKNITKKGRKASTSFIFIPKNEKNFIINFTLTYPQKMMKFSFIYTYTIFSFHFILCCIIRREKKKSLFHFNENREKEVGKLLFCLLGKKRICSVYRKK